MSKTNVEIYREFIEQVQNAKRVDLIDQYISQDCVSHGAPYVGVGIITDEQPGDRLVVADVAPGGPADGILMKGDEILQASDANGTWSTFEQLKQLVWGQGKPGVPLTLTVRRAGQVLEVPITRGLIPARTVPMATFMDGWKKFLTEDCPDFKSEIDLLMGEGDLVGYYMTNSGTDKDFQQSWINAESGFVRFKDGKVAEWWSVDDTLSRMKQLGFQVKMPEKVAESSIEK